MFNQIYTHQWLQLPQDIRLFFVKQFDLKKTGGIEVVDNKLISDGYTNDNLAKLSLESLSEFTGIKGEFKDVFEAAVDKAKELLDETDKLWKEEKPKRSSK